MASGIMTEERLLEYQREGYLMVRGLLGGAEVEWMVAALMHMNAEGPTAVRPDPLPAGVHRPLAGVSARELAPLRGAVRAAFTLGFSALTDA